jgi:hypothetical protein
MPRRKLSKEEKTRRATARTTRWRRGLTAPQEAASPFVHTSFDLLSPPPSQSQPIAVIEAIISRTTLSPAARAEPDTLIHAPSLPPSQLVVEAEPDPDQPINPNLRSSLSKPEIAEPRDLLSNDQSDDLEFNGFDEYDSDSSDHERADKVKSRPLDILRSGVDL